MPRSSTKDLNPIKETPLDDSENSPRKIKVLRFNQRNLANFHKIALQTSIINMLK